MVGLAIARQLAARGEPTILIEKHGMVGSETSSRNSEVWYIDSHVSVLHAFFASLFQDVCRPKNSLWVNVRGHFSTNAPFRTGHTRWSLLWQRLFKDKIVS